MNRRKKLQWRLLSNYALLFSLLGTMASIHQNRDFSCIQVYNWQFCYFTLHLTNKKVLFLAKLLEIKQKLQFYQSNFQKKCLAFKRSHEEWNEWNSIKYRTVKKLFDFWFWKASFPGGHSYKKHPLYQTKLTLSKYNFCPLN